LRGNNFKPRNRRNTRNRTSFQRAEERFHPGPGGPERTRPHQTAPKNVILKVSKLPGEAGKLHPGNPDRNLCKCRAQCGVTSNRCRNSPVSHVEVEPQARHYIICRDYGTDCATKSRCQRTATHVVRKPHRNRQSNVWDTVVRRQAQAGPAELGVVLHIIRICPVKLSCYKFRNRNGREEAQKAQKQTGWMAFGDLSFIHPVGEAFAQ